MTGIYLIRHAEAEGNLYRRIQGHYNGMVTLRGEKQAEALAKRFNDIHIDRVYASDLYRARYTAEAICASRGLRPIIDARLKEMNMGDWEDCTWGDVMRADPERLNMFNCGDNRWCTEGGETFEELRSRVFEAINSIAENNSGKTIAIVSHGMALREFLGCVSDSEEAMAHSDNTGVSYLEYEDNEFSLIYANDNSHLNDETSTLAKQNWWRKNTAKFDVNLGYRPLDMKGNHGRYKECLIDTWQMVHGDLSGYSDAHLSEAIELAEKEPAAVAEALCGSESCGIIGLNYERDSDDDAGCISFFYLDPKFRNRGVGVQLIGYATNFYRRLGRKKLRLRVAKENKKAKKFYERHGFEVTGKEMGAVDILYVMDKNIEQKQYGK